MKWLKKLFLKRGYMLIYTKPQVGKWRYFNNHDEMMKWLKENNNE